MKKIVLYYGSDVAYGEIIPKSYKNLSDMAVLLDEDSKKIPLVITGLPTLPNQEPPKKEKKKKVRVQNFVIFADEYSSVNEHVIINFLSFIAKMSITNS